MANKPKKTDLTTPLEPLFVGVDLRKPSAADIRKQSLADQTAMEEEWEGGEKGEDLPIAIKKKLGKRTK